MVEGFGADLLHNSEVHSVLPARQNGKQEDRYVIAHGVHYAPIRRGACADTRRQPRHLAGTVGTRLRLMSIESLRTPPCCYAEITAPDAVVRSESLSQEILLAHRYSLG